MWSYGPTVQRAQAGNELERIRWGRTNADIAAELYVEPSTVKTHVAHALAKLGLPDRVAAVIYAYETGLLTPGKS